MGLITFKNLMLFDGKSQENLAHAWITVDQASGRIQQIGNGDLPSDIPTIDLNGQYVMPGFINVHTHISLDPQAFDGGFGKSQVETTVLAYQHLRELLKSGVTFIRECGCLFDLDIELSKMQQKGLNVEKIVLLSMRSQWLIKILMPLWLLKKISLRLFIP